MALRLLEHYTSIQGEGPRTGIPTQFVRFAGCNLRCAGWPCDTPHAIFPKLFTSEQQHVGPRELAEAVGFETRRTGATNICVTGGEPFLQQHKSLVEFMDILASEYGCTVEVFTNGTIPWPKELVDYVSFVVDWKLSGSGEKPRDHVRLDNVGLIYRSENPGRHAIKFTVKDTQDVVEAEKIVSGYLLDGNSAGSDYPWIYCGVVWGTQFTTAELVEYLLGAQITWRVNVQLHNYIWPAQERMH